MASGVGVQDDCVEVFNQIKLKKDLRYIIYCMTDDLKHIRVDKTAEKDTSRDPKETWDEFKAMLNEIGEKKRQCRYVVYDFPYKTKEGIDNSKLLFIFWGPDSAAMKQKMVYSSSEDALKKKLVGFAKRVQANDQDDLDYDAMMDLVK